jgi:hypothetical protein
MIYHVLKNIKGFQSYQNNLYYWDIYIVKELYKIIYKTYLIV